MKRILDTAFSLLLMLFFAIPMLLIACGIKLTSPGPTLYWSTRVGRHNNPFKMPKFRTMKTETPALATHLLANPENYLTRFGKFLRKLSLDELPQLYSIIKGDMSFVGPRPALFNQDDLIDMRTARGVHRLLPGLTGYAQVNGRDQLSISEKVKADEYYLMNKSFILDVKILWLTVIKVLRGEGVVLEGESAKDSSNRVIPAEAKRRAGIQNK